MMDDDDVCAWYGDRDIVARSRWYYGTILWRWYCCCCAAGTLTGDFIASRSNVFRQTKLETLWEGSFNTVLIPLRSLILQCDLLVLRFSIMSPFVYNFSHSNSNFLPLPSLFFAVRDSSRRKYLWVQRSSSSTYAAVGTGDDVHAWSWVHICMVIGDGRSSSSSDNSLLGAGGLSWFWGQP